VSRASQHYVIYHCWLLTVVRNCHMLQFTGPQNSDDAVGCVQLPGAVCSQWHRSMGISDMVLPTGWNYHRLLPASAFASCVMVRSEIPPSFSSVAKTTVLRPSTPFSVSWPSSVVLSNCRPSSARCGSTSTLGIVVVANFYTSTPVTPLYINYNCSVANLLVPRHI